MASLTVHWRETAGRRPRGGTGAGPEAEAGEAARAALGLAGLSSSSGLGHRSVLSCLAPGAG